MLKIILTNSAPVSTNTVLANITQIGSGNGYTTDGNTVASTSATGTTGTLKLIGNAVTWTSVTGDMGPFQYFVLYNSTAASGKLIGWWNYGSALTLHGASGDAVTIGKDAAGANWDSTTPILTIV